MELAVTGALVHWRGPAPFHFVPVPDEQCAALEAVSGQASYGWGCIPVTARIGGTRFTTSLFPKDGGYLVPVKAAVRVAERLDLGDEVTVQLTVAV
ncbi:DUF1905 domain-containing protein [Blastococcus sp. TF02A-30]|uniref:DUF1905 domain-containing protein n=1 Tax=Blastococcus sp. TF02A-30 TaxID=2250580 RepID=UPI000DEA786F|nr:DUF1905 domain-containing protein [Blastococcus sp. TF02A-30]RBY89581.1 DUF1905 domain-containing protein [Blastococcus sp. TF02A-30]